ncbi:MAG: response regulator transcription factor [Acidobacteriota bacterium]|nr:response regulator transcription factor [Acidobacteriota bacterium]
MTPLSPGRILVVEDDPDIAELVGYHLARAGFDIDLSETGTDALERVRTEAPDLVVLDLMLPGLSGLEVCRLMRDDSRTARVPIIMLTARAQEQDRIEGLELGADDYVTKPFSPKELVARARAVLRRTPPDGSPDVLRFGPLVIDIDRHEVTENGGDVRLTAKEFLLLHYLITHRGRVLSRDLLLSDVWGYQYTGGTRTVDVHIRRLREKLPSLVGHIVTIKQFGYKFVEHPVRHP